MTYGFAAMTNAQKVLRAEMALRKGPVPGTLEAAEREAPTFSISKSEFLLKLPNGLKFHYRRGVGVTYEQPDHVTEAEVILFFNGSVFGAIAWLNEYVPLHASAVVHDGAVHAFTGVSGAGKSTLAAALGNRGFPLMADDVLVLDLNDPDQVLCLPGHKRMKLWEDALELTGTSAAEKVRPQLEKFYAMPTGGTVEHPLPLGRLYFLSDRGDEPTMTAIRGFERFTRTKAAFYRPRFCDAITEKRDLFAIAKRVSHAAPMSAFDRPRGKRMFDEAADFAAATIKAGSD